MTILRHKLSTGLTGRRGLLAAVAIGLAAMSILVAPAAAPALPISLDSKLGAANNFVLLDLAGGTITINSATSITGNVGYSANVTSHTNQKVDTFLGQALVHSTADFQFTAATFAPSLGILVGGAADTALDQANVAAASAATFFAALPSNGSLGAVTTSQNLTATGDVNVYDLSSINFNTATLTLNGDGNDLFVFRVSGNLDWSHAQTILNGVSPDQVLFYFPNASTININKADNVFIGTVLAPTGSVDYHNPATFNGEIIARDIVVHSDFNISGPTPPLQVPAPSSAALVGSGLLAVCLALRRLGA